MKTFILLSLLITCFTAGSQNFIVQNGALIWQRIYENPDNHPVKPLTLQLEKVSINGSDYSGQINKTPVNYTAYGMKRMQMPLYMTQPFRADVHIEIKPDKYRVTVSNILFDDLADASLLTTESTSPLSDYAVTSSGQIREGQKKALAVFDQDLTVRFTIQNQSDW